MSFQTFFRIPALWNVCHEWQSPFCSSLNWLWWENVRGLPLSIRRAFPCAKTSVSILIVSSRAMLIKGKARWDGTMALSCICCVINEGNYSTLHSPKPMWMIVTRRFSTTWLRFCSESSIRTKDTFHNLFLLHSSIGEFTSSREYALIWRTA